MPANGEETEPKLLSAATGHIAAQESASHPGTVPWYRRRESRVGLGALLVLALLLALLLLNGESTPPVKSATRAAPKAAPRRGPQISGQGVTQVLPESVTNSFFTFPDLFGNPNDDAGQVSVGSVPFAFWVPGASFDPVTVPVEIPTPLPPGGTL